MYEKPQYPTPDGYRRLSRNPSKDGSLKREISDLITHKSISKQVSPDPRLSGSGTINPNVARYLRSKQQPAISENAAKLIALTIKGLLKSK